MDFVAAECIKEEVHFREKFVKSCFHMNKSKIKYFYMFFFFNKNDFKL